MLFENFCGLEFAVLPFCTEGAGALRFFFAALEGDRGGWSSGQLKWRMSMAARGYLIPH